MASLQEQLLKAGLTTKQKARQANSVKRKQNKQKRSGVDHGISLQEQVQQDLVKDRSEKLAKDAALNQQKKQVLAVKEQLLRISQILEHHQLKNVSGEIEYNYNFENKIKKLFVDTSTHNALVNGRLALCGWENKTYIVTTETATKLAELDAKVVLVQNERVTSAGVNDNDPYADYQIPDDLMW